MRQRESAFKAVFSEHHLVPETPSDRSHFLEQSGAPSGAPRMASGAPTRKAGLRPASNFPQSISFLRAGEGIRTLDVDLGKVALYR